MDTSARALRFVVPLASSFLLGLGGLPARAEAPALDDGLAARVQALALEASRQTPPGARVEVELGRLDPRLRLAPCAEVQPHLPPNARLWGRSRIGLRCVDGPVHWNVWLPLTVKVFAPALVAAQPLAAGRALAAADLRVAEVEVTAHAAVLGDAAAAVGRTLARPLAAGAPLRAAHLQPRRWFDAGDTVRVVAAGAGYSVSGEGQALGHGIEGRPVRVRVGERVLSGRAVAARRVELPL